jgi:hypothetical protein
MKRLLCALMVVFMAGSAYAQSHQIGTLWTTNEMVWPGGFEESRTDPDVGYRIGHSGMAVVGLFETFNVPSYFEASQSIVNTTVQFWANDLLDDLADLSPADITGKIPKLGNTPNPKFFRVTPPTLTQDGSELLRNNWRLFTNLGDAVQSSLGSDFMIESKIVTAEGLTVRTQTYSWANTDADDMIFEVRTITYPTTPYVIDLRAGERGIASSSETASKNPEHKNFHLGLNYFLQRGGSGPAGGAHITITPEDQGRAYDAGVLGGIWDEVNVYDDTEKLIYAYDGDDQGALGFRADGDDRGEPGPGPGDRLTSAGNARVSAGEFLESHYKGRVFLHVDKTPTSSPDVLGDNWLEDNSDPENVQPRQMRWVPGEVWTSTRTADRKTVHDFYVQPSTTRDQRIETSDPEKPGYVTSQQIYQWLTTFGPWDLKVGESIHIVSAAIVAGPSESENKRVGAQWLNGTISFAEKEEFLDSGLDSMMATVQVARNAWANRTGIAPSLPAVPAWPSNVTFTSGPDQNELSWAAVSGASIYRVYKHVGFETTVPELLAEVTGTTYNDADVIRGQRYFYSVTAVDANGLESSRFATRNFNDGVSPFRGPVSDITSVRIVPNPFQVQGGDLGSGGYNFTGQPNKLQFVNLPAVAIIRIFTVTGDLVTRIDHTSGSGDESWDLMITDNNQFLTSGIYFAHIENPSNGDKHIERFVVVR